MIFHPSDHNLVFYSEHFCTWVEEVIVPIFKNRDNLAKFPRCLALGEIGMSPCLFGTFSSLDMKRQVHDMAETVHQIKGHIKGKTLLPFPEVRNLDI